jgi:hypothetical protein
MNEREEKVEVKKIFKIRNKNIQTKFFYIAISEGIF